MSVPNSPAPLTTTPAIVENQAEISPDHDTDMLFELQKLPRGRSEEVKNNLNLLYLAATDSPSLLTQESVVLSTQDWVSILDVATKYGMNKIKAKALLRLEDQLGAFEQIKLGREHLVAPLFIQGVTALVHSPMKYDPNFAAWPVSWETVSRILWIRLAQQDCTSVGLNKMEAKPMSGTPLCFRYASMTCWYCHKPFNADGGSCMGCGLRFDEKETFVTADWMYAQRNFGVRLAGAICKGRGCGLSVFQSRQGDNTFHCPNCKEAMGMYQHTHSAERAYDTEDLIKRAFGREMEKFDKN